MKKENNIPRFERGKQMNELQVIPDPKQDIKFWLDALSNPNVNRESIEKLNKCLQNELTNYLHPAEVKIVPKEKDLLKRFLEGN